jgi:hypothetical protein
MTDTELAAAVGTIQDAIAAILAGVLTKSVIRNRWVMNANRETWAGLLESKEDTDTEGANKVHAATVAFAGLQTPPRSAQQLQSISLQLTFAVDFFYQYDAGTDTDNSEVTLRLDTVTAVFELWKHSDLGVRALVKGHDGLQMPPNFDVIPLGGKLVHQASGTITVMMQSQQVT